MAAFMGHAVLAFWFVEKGRLNSDEGWYLYAARQISQGLQPYSDFGFFQVPVYPQILAGLLDPGPGSLIAGRWLSLFFMFLAVGVTALGARRLGGNKAAAVALFSMGLHPLLVSSSVLAKPYALAMLLLAGGLFVLAGKEQRTVRVGIAFLLLALASGTRLSLILILPPLLWGQRRRDVLPAVVGATVGLLLVMRPMWGVDPSVLWDHLIGFHISDGGGLLDRISWGWHAVTVWALLLWGLIPGSVSERIPGLRVGVLLVVVVHLLPAELHIEHLAVLAPAMVFVLVERWSNRRTISVGWVSVGLVLAVLSTGASLRFIHVDSTHSTVQQATDLGQWIRKHTPPNKPILTQHVELAVEADRSVPPGFEMGRFGWDESLSASEANRFHRASSSQLSTDTLESLGAVIMATDDFDSFTHARISIWAKQNVNTHRQVEAYGQFGDRLDIWVPALEAIVFPGESL
ncbi:MAG: hypothetical protein ACPGTU_08145 [Myxococcota bacterium]